MPVRLGAALVAEFLGTFALCFFGILGINHSGGNLVIVALAHGLILSCVVTAAMPTSGGHVNPAITLGFMLTGKIKPTSGIAYIAIQLLAGIVAALIVYAMFGAGGEAAGIVYRGTPDIRRLPDGAAFSMWAGLVAEIVGAFFLAFVVWGTAADPRARDVGGFAIGLTVAAGILAFGPISGASFNPARSFGPALVAMITKSASTDNVYPSLWQFHWIQWVGPIVGAGIAALLYHLVLWPRDSGRGIDPAALDVPATQRP